MAPHPLDELNAAEILTASSAARSVHNDPTIRFKYISLLEPPKDSLLPFLDAERAQFSTAQTFRPPRLAVMLYSVGIGDKQVWYEAVYDYASKKLVQEFVPNEFKAPADFFEYLELEDILLKDPKFIKAVEKYKLPIGAKIAADPWLYGSDTAKHVPRLWTFMVYFRNPANNDPDSNIYAHPLPICPVMDATTFEVVELLECPTGGTEDGSKVDTLDTNDPVGHLVGSEYAHELQDGPLRTDLMPIHISQPQGPSFKIHGRRVYWQKWSFIVGFNYREALTIHDVHYDGRSVMHRLSVSEMNVPYGDPRPPYHRKQAFDAGDIGLGISANQLDLGCDCLGLIKGIPQYFDAVLSNADGTSRVMKNVVCMHEVDDGVSWKHTNYRTDRAVMARSRHLVLQTICTVANYEYIWIWKFDTAGAIHFEVRATGVLSTSYIDKGKTSPYGNVVAPGVLAQDHQHIIIMRMDPAIDGHKNTLVYDEQVPMLKDDPENPYGTGWKTKREFINQSGYADANPLANRTFKMINEEKINPVSMRPIGYQLMPHFGAMQLSHPDSVAHQRGEYGDHPIWVTKHRDAEYFAAGKYTNQSSGNARGMRTMAARKDNVRNDDIVVWHSFALTHSPRVEDFPVMPCEKIEITLKPIDFFTKNPALDVPQASQTVNASTLFETQPTSGCEKCPKL